MKIPTHVLFVLLVLFPMTFLVNCSGDETFDNNSANPPNWIKGRWLQENTPPPIQNGFYFTNDDFGLITIGGDVSQVQVCLASNPNMCNIDETETDNYYQIVFDNDFTVVRYTFNLHGSDKITFEEAGNSAFFIKQ